MDRILEELPLTPKTMLRPIFAFDARAVADHGLGLCLVRIGLNLYKFDL
jgi:hypothetical protein